MPIRTPTTPSSVVAVGAKREPRKPPAWLAAALAAAAATTAVAKWGR